MRNWVMGLAAVGMVAMVGTAAWADEDYDKAIPAVTKNLPKAKLSLADGINAASKAGKPISAQYEIDEDTHKFQLSVFVSSGSELLEVLVNYTSGAPGDAENVTGDDIKDAKAQKKAMDKAKMSLADAVNAAVKDNSGYQAIQIVPSLDGNDAVATIKLVKGTDVKTVKEKLS